MAWRVHVCGACTWQCHIRRTSPTTSDRMHWCGVSWPSRSLSVKGHIGALSDGRAQCAAPLSTLISKDSVLLPRRSSAAREHVVIRHIGGSLGGRAADLSHPCTWNFGMRCPKMTLQFQTSMRARLLFWFKIFLTCEVPCRAFVAFDASLRFPSAPFFC